MQWQWTISQMGCDLSWKVDFIGQLAMTSLVARLRRHSKVLPKAKLAPKKKKKVTGTVWWSAASLIHCSFLNPSKTIISERSAYQIDEIHWKLQCLQSALVNRKGPILHDNAWLHVTQPMLQKLNELGNKVLPYLSYSPDLSPTKYHFFKYLNNHLQGKHFQNQEEAENAFQEFTESWSMIFMLKE